MKGIIPEGTRDLIFNESGKKEIVTEKLNKIYSSFGYDSVVTPTLEFYETFCKRADGFKDEMLYKTIDKNGKMLVLRPDMTLPIGRVVKTKMRDVEMPIRIKYCSNVFNVYGGYCGKRNEYTDCGVEFIGDKSISSDLEILVLAIEGLKSFNSKKFKLEIGHIGFINSIFEEINLSEDMEKVIAHLIENKNLIALDEVLEGVQIEEEYKELLRELSWLFGDVEVLDQVLKYKLNENVIESLNYMKKLYEGLKSLGYEDNISFDLGMIPRVNYYMGIMFKGYLDGACSTVLSGGRYEITKENEENLDAIGFSINVDLVAENVEEVRKEKEVVLVYGSENLIKAMEEARRLRSLGERVKLKKSENKNDFKIERGE
ncbi:MAG: ATP phosphoribosyltransferase regulatory subunit [Clostridium sp.]|uniref:ATP phosphoribosyltransferase regulatory subunit n=1 Tax=Clostridium sp. TaxID=1506 RepID=UPI003F2D4FFD